MRHNVQIQGAAVDAAGPDWAHHVDQFWLYPNALREAARRAEQTGVRHRVEATNPGASGLRQWRVEPVNNA